MDKLTNRDFGVSLFSLFQPGTFRSEETPYHVCLIFTVLDSRVRLIVYTVCVPSHNEERHVELRNQPLWLNW